jgi:4-amino-4-deoxy-L-arabinose transferase-like glycosyltransferase
MEQETERTPADNELGKTGWWRDFALLAVLLAIAVGLRGWLLWNTEVAARDSIGFIRYALQFEGMARPPHTKTWVDVVRNNHQHPGYPISILAVSYPVRYFLGGLSPYAMQLSAQLASGLAAVLLVLPIYFLGKVLFDRGIGFWAALLFQCLPVSGHILSDGLSESLFLLLCCSSLLCAALAVRGSTWWHYALCGAFCGLTYLVRPEGGLVLAATGLVLVAMQLAPRGRRPWGAFGACCASLTIAAAVVGSPYVLITGQLTNKPSYHQMVGTYPEKASTANRRSGLDRKAAAPVAHAPGSPGMRPLLMGSIMAVWLDPDEPLAIRLPEGLRALAEEFIRGFHYIGWIPALLGLCWYAGRARTVPGIGVVLVLCALQFLVLWRLAVVVGYVSERHIQILILAACYPAVGVLRDLPRWLAARWCATHTGLRPSVWNLGASLLSLLLLFGLVAAGMPKTLQKLHANRAGYHAAGQWLAQQVVHGVDQIDDGHCWAHFYAGEVFQEGKPQTLMPGTRYHVVGRHKDPESTSSPAEPPPTGQIVYHWPPQRPAEKADVVIYATPLAPSPLTNPSKS